MFGTNGYLVDGVVDLKALEPLPPVNLPIFPQALHICNPPTVYLVFDNPSVTVTLRLIAGDAALQ